MLLVSDEPLYYNIGRVTVFQNSADEYIRLTTKLDFILATHENSLMVD